ncbi:glycosyltransferase [Bacillus alkalicellulosilyticus]|uniref:glycosyltransferase n=1 Tax=Alkalihalobacterium alkalicellulosilyticum TaxID=1912214 RepID=UPI000996DBFD|nr:glycosyltransferase family A protein [Bacillus alkalicellulosilyticus]
MISVITSTIRDSSIDTVFKNFHRQNWKEKELIIILNKDAMNSEMWFSRARQYENVFVYRIDQRATLGQCLNYGIERAKHPYIAKFDDDDYYGSNYLNQAHEAIQLDEEIGIVGKNAYYIYLTKEKSLLYLPYDENRYVESVAGATLFFKKKLWEEIPFRMRNKGEDYFFIIDTVNKGYKVYATDRKNFIVIRNENKNHTWQDAIEFYKKWATPVDFTGHFSSIVE